MPGPLFLTVRGARGQPSRVATLVCQSCGARVPYDEPIPRDAECESCKTDLRCCRNCRHYEPRVNNQCSETQADPVVEKTRRNFCEFFYFSREAYAAGGAGKASEARAKLDSLFGGPASAAPEDARKKLESMFGGATKPASEREAEAREKLKGLFGEGKKPD